jgi:hypothetical protein
LVKVTVQRAHTIHIFIERRDAPVQIVGLTDPTNPDIGEAESLLRPIVPGKFSAIYEPEMPDPDGKLFRWFQVAFAVGPGDAKVLRAQVHELFPRMLAALSPLASVHQADVVSLRARRFLPGQSPRSDRPSMFIQADWAGTAIRQMRTHKDFSVWPIECLTYRNYHDKGDVFNKRPEGSGLMD